MSAPEQLESLRRWLQQCARGGLPCPSNADIGERYGRSPNGAARMLVELEELGVIEVERLQAGRIVTIKATRESTQAPPRMAPHWRGRAA